MKLEDLDRLEKSIRNGDDPDPEDVLRVISAVRDAIYSRALSCSLCRVQHSLDSVVTVSQKQSDTAEESIKILDKAIKRT